MASSILYRTISGDSDGRLVMQNSWSARNWDATVLPATWSVIRLGVVINILDADSITDGHFDLGITSGTTNPNGTETPDHFLGVRFGTDFGWSKSTTGGGTDKWEFGLTPLLKIEAGSETTGSSQSSVETIRGTAHRTALFIQITKGSPNYTITRAWPNSDAAMETDITIADFETMMSDAIASLSNSYFKGADHTIAVDTGTYGDWTGINLTWNKSTPACEICAVAISRIS